MVEVQVCVGSSCHMKGSYQVIKSFESLIKSNGLEDEVKLKASFCLGCCLNGIAMKVNDRVVESVGFSNAESIFYSEVMPEVEAERGSGE